MVKSLINLNCKPSAYIDARKKEDIEDETKEYLSKNNILFYPESEVEGCEGNKKVEKVYIRNSSNKISSINASLHFPQVALTDIPHFEHSYVAILLSLIMLFKITIY